MITLDLLPVCEDCPEFEPVKTDNYNIMHFGKVVESNCKITCENIDKCKAILEYLQKEVRKNG